MSGGMPYPAPLKKRHRFVIWPTTRLGRWSVGMAVASVVLGFAWSFLGPLGGAPGLALGFAGGIVALVAIVRRGDRALTVYAALIPFLQVFVLVLGELLFSH